MTIGLQWRRPAAALILLALAACGNTGGMPDSAAVPPPATNSAAASQGQSYLVIPGDTVDSVAQQHNVPVEALIQANHLAYPYALTKGQVLLIPGAGAPMAPPSDYVVVRGDTLIRVARQHGTTVAALAAANGLSSPYVLKVGQHLTLPGAPAPVQSAALGAAPATMQLPPATPAPSLPAAGSSQVSTEALAPLPGASVAPAPSAAAAAVPAAVPATSSNAGHVATLPPPLLQPAMPASPPPSATQPATSQPASIEPTKVQPSTTPSTTGTAAAGTAAGATSLEAQARAPSEGPAPAPRGSGKFLWPVNGKIVSAYGVKDGGQHNDGINIAAPLGTPVHAAENGVVVYAGNELRGWGNLLLIRHADGWVSAYAHCEALLVKRGDQVKRGQVIARVGQTGAVASPQLHFELRKSGQAIDPASELGPQGA